MSLTGGDFNLLFYRFGGRINAPSSDKSAAFDEVGSVVAEVTLLLNTRSPFSGGVGVSRRTVLEYGLADFSHYSPGSRQDAQLLAKLIRETVIAYEPRLVIDSVTVETPRSSRDCLSALISGYVRKRDRSIVSVTFPVSVGVTA